MKIYIITFLVFLTFTTTALASGWNDYRLDIGDGYSIFRGSSFDRGISYNNSSLISPWAFSEIGPVYGYCVTEDYIFARAYGRKMRNKFKGDTFEEIDLSKQFYFVLRKGVNEIAGPLSLEEFQQNDIAKQHLPIQWTKPKNPNFWLPLLGGLMFLALVIPILAVKFYWITIPVIIVVALLIRHIRKKRKEKAQQLV